MTESEAFCCLSAAIRLLGAYPPKEDFSASCQVVYANAENALRLLGFVPSEAEAIRTPPTGCVRWPVEPDKPAPGVTPPGNTLVVKLSTEWWEARRAKDWKKAADLKRRLKVLGFSTEDVAPTYKLIPETPCPTPTPVLSPP